RAPGPCALEGRRRKPPALAPGRDPPRARSPLPSPDGDRAPCKYMKHSHETAPLLNRLRGPRQPQQSLVHVGLANKALPSKPPRRINQLSESQIASTVLPIPQSVKML